MNLIYDGYVWISYKLFAKKLWGVETLKMASEICKFTTDTSSFKITI